MSLQDLLISNFISRADVLATQFSSGSWSPLREDPSDTKSALLPWNRDRLQAHLDGKATYGHYMLGLDNTVKLVAFDIDFDKSGFCPSRYDEFGVPLDFEIGPLRDLWHDRANPHRTWMKSRLRNLSHLIAATVKNEFDLRVACAYTGNKGVHVYGFFDESIPAADARLCGELTMKALNANENLECNFELNRGSFEWKDHSPEPGYSFGNMTIEVFPKQDTVDSGFGNLMALPLGVNRKNPADPKFFIDMRVPMNQLVPVDPEWALSTDNPWKD